MSVHWDQQSSQQFMRDLPRHQADAMRDAITDGVNVAEHKAMLHPPGSSKRTKRNKKKVAA